MEPVSKDHQADAGPLVSVITPCYNAAPFIAQTIAAVRAQNYPRVEHIVIDDASSDGSWDIISQFGRSLTALRLPQNRGASHARNRGAACAKGELLMFLDADDLIAPNALEGLVAAVRGRSDAIGICRWRRLRPSANGWEPAPPGVSFPPPADALRGWLEGIWVPPCAVLWPRELYHRTGGWDETTTVNDDGDLMMRALCDGACLVVAASGEGFYRSHGSSRLSLSTRMYAKGRCQSQLLVLERLTDRLVSKGALDRYAASVGIAYQRIALPLFQIDPELARECQRRGERLAGVQAVSRTWAGRLLTRLLGVEHKERVASLLARCGMRTSARRRLQDLERLHEDE